ncbi:MAG: LacI family DNA-binding transcriptional regulator [Anaerolineae bacterium]
MALMTKTSKNNKRASNKRPSMKDVADLAGVSRTTVSFVLNKKPDANIPAETQAKVWDAVKSLSYRPNAIAQNLRAQSTNTIGFISDEIATTPFAVRILQGAQKHAWENKKLLLTVNTGGDAGIRDAAVNMLLERQVDGIIYATMYHREVNPPQQIREVPTVLLDCFIADKSLPSVVPDEELGGYEATKHLLEKGHRSIAFICENMAVPAKLGRMIGYKKALAEFGVEFDESIVTYAPSTPESGREKAQELFAGQNRPSAVFCYNDRTAMGVYDGLRELGLSIPDDVAVVGFDNQELIAADIRPGLTTMALPHYEMGQWAVNHLLKLIENKHNAASSETLVQQLLPCPLIKRNST